ncbi:hypothetical protein [Streptomyces sp. NBC_00829]|uniref:hypothetical protein n=1 Tax=Streptomyces sp. NBC_00829 TaxID=2903679 RepID=UPI00386F1941|nr:ATP-binding protein [Streptomyces sp. NBC_00829]
MQPGIGMGLRGRSGIISLVDACLRQLPTAERPVVMLLGPRGSGASEAHSALMEHFGPEYPFAYVNFDGTHSLLPRYALALLARQLERKLPRYGRSQFPLLTLGLLASDQELRINSLAEGRRAIQRQLDRFQEDNEERHGDYLAAFFDVAAGAVGAPDGFSGVALALLQDALRRGRRRLPGRVFGGKYSASAAWYGGHPLTRSHDQWEALVELNLWRHEGDEQEQDQLNRVLFSAFLEDLRRNSSRSFMPRSYLLLLDNSHSVYGRRFLDLLIRARHDDSVVAGHRCDPLAVVASSNRWLPRWGPATGDSWPWQLRGPDRASLADWQDHRPPRDSDDTWWYPLRLRDLNLDEVRIRIELQLGDHPELATYTRLTPFVHRLTGGLPRAVHQVLDVLRQSATPAEDGPGQDRWLRTLPDRTLRVGEENRTLSAVALAHLLRGFNDVEKAALSECAAARDLSVGARILSPGDGLFGEVRSRWLLHSPGAVTPTLHPWLRRLLLWELARRPGDWDTVHELLSEHFRCEEQPVPEMYHRMAMGQIDEVTDHLLHRFPAVPAVQWITEFNSITGAPNRLPVEGGPLELLAGLAPRTSQRSVDAASAIRGLVTARWVWSDPLADPAMRLNDMIADGFTQLSQLRRTDIVALFNEAERYRHWRHPQTTACES